MDGYMDYLTLLNNNKIHMAIETRQICLQFDIDYSEKIKELATIERRSFSSMAAILLIEALEAREKKQSHKTEKQHA